MVIIVTVQHTIGEDCIQTYCSTSSTTAAPIKPSKQTQILLDQMSKNTDEEKTKWDQVMENFDLLYARINDMGITQQELKTQI